MTKTTKFIAALGVVAGLGVAALPMSTYAAEISGDVDVEVTINDAIAMKITSNSDDYVYTAVSNPTGNPSEQGWYTESDGTYTATSDTEVQAGTTYYTRSAEKIGFLGVNPAGTTAAGETEVAGPSKASVTMNANSVNYDTLYSNIAVRSNTGEFTLTVIDDDEDTALGTTSDGTNKFIPSTGGTLVGTTANWGYFVGDGAADTTWLAMPASNSSAATITSNGTNTLGSYSDNIKVSYGVATGSTESGTYSDTITYTATTK